MHLTFTIESLDQGCLLTATDHQAEIGAERLAYQSDREAIAALMGTLDALLGPPAVRRAEAVVSPAPTPDPEPEPELVQPDNVPPPATRRIGLMQPRKSSPPAGRVRP